MSRNNKDGRLPLTRKEQIWYLIKNEIGILFLSNIVTFLFVLPLLLVFFFTVTTFHHYTLDSTKVSGDYFNLFLMFGLLMIPSCFILGIGRSGLTSVIKQLVFESTTSFSSYFKGIVKNFKVFAFNYLLLGILSGALMVNYGYFRYIEGNIYLKAVLLGANILLLLTLLICIPSIEFEGVTFNNYLFAYLRNGVYIFYKTFPLSLISLLLVIFPIILVGFIPISIFFIPLGMLATFYLSLSSLITFIINIYSYEKLLTKEQIPEIYHKGLEEINL